jgi:hypothetical protein
MRANANFALKTILQVNFSDKLKLDLPYGYEESWVADCKHTHKLEDVIFILKELMPGTKMAPEEKIVNFIKLIGSQTKEDAMVLIWMKDGELSKNYRGLSKQMVQSAFPGLIQDK